MKVQYFINDYEAIIRSYAKRLHAKHIPCKAWITHWFIWIDSSGRFALISIFLYLFLAHIFDIFCFYEPLNFLNQRYIIYSMVKKYCEYVYLFYKTEKQTLIPVITEQKCCTALTQTCYWKYELEEIVTQTKQCKFYDRLCVVVKKRVSHDGGI